jgi:hypothetical protein
MTTKPFRDPGTLIVTGATKDPDRVTTVDWSGEPCHTVHTEGHSVSTTDEIYVSYDHEHGWHQIGPAVVR